MSIPLVKKLDLDSVNTTIIAIKRLLQQAGVSEGGNTIINNNSDGGIPLGTWASFENDSAPNGEWLQGGSSFDPNTYPALAMMLGGNTVPERFDHSKLGDNEDVKSFFSNGGWNTNKIIPYDGFIEVSSYGTSNDSICYVNDIQIFRWYASSSITSSESYLIPVRKGDNVRFSASIDRLFARYYTHPLFIKATPTSSDSDYEGTLNAIRTYVDNNTQPKSKVWVAVIQDTGATALNLVGIVIPNASKVTSVGFQTIHREGQSDPMQYVYVDLVNNSSFRLNNGMFYINMIVNGTYDSINDTWTITSRTATSLGFTTMKVNYLEDVTVKNS